MMSRSIGRRRLVRKFIPVVVVLAVASVVVLGALSSLSGVAESFNFEVYFPSPVNYTPGTTPPVAILQINYTGPGQGNYTYVVTYDSASGSFVAGHGSALVSSGTPFRLFVFIHVPLDTTVVATAEVFRGGPQPQTLLYTKSITL